MGEDIFVTHDGLRFRCRLDGQGAGAPWVVFSNSMLTDLTVWDAQVAVLQDRFRILRYDQRGHGRSDPPEGPCTLDLLGADLAAVLDHFEVESCAFVELSMGVPTGLHLVGHQPHRVSRMVLSDGQSATAPNGFASWGARIDEAREIGMEAVAAATMERWFSAGFRATGGAEAVHRAAAATSLEGYIGCAQALQAYDFRAVLGGISVPVLLTAGADDGAMPASMQAMAGAIPGAVLKLIPEAGHIPCVEQAEAFNRHLLAFLG
jgi:3-oxoadipate enol-lactonase